MINTIKHLALLKLKLITKNPEYLIVVLIPIGFMLIYDMILDLGNLSGFLLMIGLTLTFSMSSGMLVSTMIAEEKEKNTLKSLKLIGVRSEEYAIASLIIPMLINLVTILGFYYWLNGENISATFGQYFLVTLLTGLASTLMFFLFGIISNTQSQSIVYSLLGMLIVLLLPMVSEANDVLSTILNFSFMGIFTDLLLNDATAIFSNQLFYILIFWLVGLTVINLYAYKKLL